MGTGQNCTRLLNYTKILLHEGTKSHEDNFAELQFCSEGHFCTSKKKLTDKLIKKEKKELPTEGKG